MASQSQVQVCTTKNDTSIAQGPSCTKYGWINTFSWVAAVAAVALLVTGSIFLAIVGNGVSTGYLEANCTATVSGGIINHEYCACDKCKCKKTCCDYKVVVAPFPGFSSFDRAMRKRSCNTGSPCKDWYGQLQAQEFGSQSPESKSFPCLYSQDKLNNAASATLYCIEDIGYCDIVTLPEHLKLVEYGKYVQSLLPLWIILVVLGVVALPVLPLRIAYVGPRICDCVEPSGSSSSNA
jgi:hypothetical protein